MSVEAAKTNRGASALECGTRLTCCETKRGGQFTGRREGCQRIARREISGEPDVGRGPGDGSHRLESRRDRRPSGLVRRVHDVEHLPHVLEPGLDRVEIEQVLPIRDSIPKGSRQRIDRWAAFSSPGTGTGAGWRPAPEGTQVCWRWDGVRVTGGRRWRDPGRELRGGAPQAPYHALGRTQVACFP